MKVSLTNLLLLFVFVGIALAWFADHRVQIRKHKMLENTVSQLRAELDHSFAGNALIRGYLNFFRIENGTPFSADDYKHQLSVLKREYSRRFPEWAATQQRAEENADNHAMHTKPH